MGVHDGHRQRLKTIYKESGGTALSDINILEFLLFYAIPRKDTNVLAHNLINAFGSLEKVFRADVSELCAVDGISENAALLIKLIPDIQSRLMIKETGGIKQITSAKDAGDYFIALLNTKGDENFCVMCLDAKNRILNVSTLGKGSVNEVSVSIRSIVDNVVRYRATSVIIAHNHPDGICAPSQEDIELTNSIAASLQQLSIGLLDHIIVAAGNYYSFAVNSMI